MADPDHNRTHITHYGPIEVVPSRTSCKHGPKDCEACGTTSLRDNLHRTQSGRGAIARISKKP